jgi:hypothetical protein
MLFLDATFAAGFFPKLVFLQRENFANFELPNYTLNRARSVDDDLGYCLRSEDYTTKFIPFGARENFFGELWFNR